MAKLTAEKYRELFKLRAEGKLGNMECTKRLFDILKPLFSERMSILDVSCGVGHYFRKVKELGTINYLGVDLDAKAIEIANEVWKDYPNVSFKVMNASKLELENNSYDIVYCYNLLLHLKDYKDVLKELLRVSGKHVIVRSLFDDEYCTTKHEASVDYRNVYSDGFFFYNTYARDDVRNFLNNLGSFKIEFLDDNSKIPENELEKQAKLLEVNSTEFAKTGAKKLQEWKGLKLNYEILIIEKE